MPEWIKMLRLKLAFSMHLALSTMQLTLLSANIIALFDDISWISLSPILATISGSKPKKDSLHDLRKKKKKGNCKL